MKAFYSFFPYLTLILFVTSCSYTNKFYYFNNQTPSIQNFDTLKKFATLHVHKNDRLTITVSSTDPSLTAYLNPFGNNNLNQSITGYLVNENGAIEFPLLGKLTVEGLTTAELSSLIKEKLTYYYKDLFVNVNINGRVYFINGNSGIAIPLINERTTIFEALSQTGLQQPFDIKNDIWLIREDSGKRYFAQLNLRDKKIFESPYYYLHNNDLLYNKPNKINLFLQSSSPFRNIISIVGALAALIFAIKK